MKEQKLIEMMNKLDKLDNIMQEVIKEMISGRSGIYALYRRNSLFYVGLATNLSTRLKQHLKDRLRGRWDRLSVYLAVRDDHIKELESLILRIVSVPGNRTGGRFVNSKNLGPSLARLMAEVDADRRAVLLGGKAAERRQRKRAKKTGISALKGLLERRRPLRGYRGEYEYRATLRKDGRISYDGEVYDSPRAAARAAVGGPCNGWSFWRFKDASGKWVPLRRLKS